MGRPFDEELASLPENISFALEHPVAALADALETAKKGRILACGAGGSFSAASFAQLLLQEARVDAQAVTPLHVLQTSRPFEPTTLILFTAGGRNKDVLRTIDHAVSQGIRVVLICASPQSPAAKLAAKSPGNRIYDFAYPARRDGFLAVNSLAVTWWLMARALGFTPPGETIARQCAAEKYDLDFVPVDRRHACLLLHDRWTRPVAIDLESKMTEAALSAPLVSDWRQFGHGRHHWLAKNAPFSSVLALETSEGRLLAEKSLRLIPRAIPATTLSSDLPGVTGVCQLLLSSFAFIAALGGRVGIDPGRPGVPPFGSSLYHLAAPRPKLRRPASGWDLNEAAARKIDALRIREISATVQTLVAQAAEAASAAMRAAEFGAVVLDFDGTIAESGLMPNQPLSAEITEALVRLMKRKITVGIATGRGDSCHSNLAVSIPEEYWPQILVSHYNGTGHQCLYTLLDQPTHWPSDDKLHAIFDELKASPLLTEMADIAFKGVQITLRTKPRYDSATVETLIRTSLSRQTYGRLVVSSHTLDVIPTTVSKRSLVDHIRQHHARGHEVLTIGDRGDHAGNDFELLSTPCALSVDRVSGDLRTGWNFLPQAVTHYRGTVHYLTQTRTSRGVFRLSPK